MNFLEFDTHRFYESYDPTKKSFQRLREYRELLKEILDSNIYYRRLCILLISK